LEFALVLGIHKDPKQRIISFEYLKNSNSKEHRFWMLKNPGRTTGLVAHNIILFVFV
jgi:hypothetical protein